MSCPENLVEGRIDRLRTQYRESNRLLGLMRNYLEQIDEAIQVGCGIVDYFDLDTAVGDQLTLIGKRMGWPRCHCVCAPSPVVGFDCGGPYGVAIAGFCDNNATWINCDEIATADLCLTDDEVYRGYLRARRYQILGLYDIASLQTALRHVWGDTATVYSLTVGTIVLAPGRALTAQETLEIPMVIRVMPIAPGIRAQVSLGTGAVGGFGAGWGGFCDSSEWLCPIDAHAYDCGV